MEFPRWHLRAAPSEALFPLGTRGFATEEVLSPSFQGRAWLRTHVLYVRFLISPPSSHGQEIQGQTPSRTNSCQKQGGPGGRWHWPSEHSRISRSLHSTWGRRKTTYGSFWPVYPLTKDLVLENPFPVVGLPCPFVWLGDAVRLNMAQGGFPIRWQRRELILTDICHVKFDFVFIVISI